MDNPYQSPASDPSLSYPPSLDRLPSFGAFKYPFRIEILRSFVSPSLHITDARGHTVLTAKRAFLGLESLSIYSGVSGHHRLGKIDRTMFTGGISPKIYSPHGEALATLSQPLISAFAKNHSLTLTDGYKPFIHYTESRPFSSFTYGLFGGIIGLNLIITRFIKTRLSIYLGDNRAAAMTMEHLVSRKRSSLLHKHRDLSREDEYLILMGMVYIMLISRIRG